MSKFLWYMFLARPLPENVEARERAGAYVNVWVNYADDAGAEKIARALVAEVGWSSGKSSRGMIMSPAVIK